MSIAASDVNHQIWGAVVGPSVKIAAVNSYVYYFPQGHLENSSNVDRYDGTTTVPSNPSIPCRVISLRFLSSSSSDESYVKILLQPLHPAELIRARHEEERENNDQIDVDSFSKVLTPSDANNGGGFSVPKYCADAIFPNLDLSDDPPVQNLSIRDTHGNAWEFRHIYRGTPRRHLLTTGWSKFVNGKRLVAGDSVVFMKRRSTGGLFFGIRRKARIGGDESGRVEAAMAAIENAAKGLVFEVDYYPRDGSPDFVVSAARVVASMRVQWCEGMRVKMPVSTDDPARTTWYEGRITSANSQSPWRMLKVTWEEPGIQPNMDKVSPWEVEFEPPMLSPHLSLAFPPYKKLKLSPNIAISLHEDGDQGEFSFPLAESAASFPYAPFPIVECDDSPHRSFTELLKRGMEKEPETVSTVLSIGSSNSDRSSNVQQGLNPSTIDGRRSILLFGKTIRTGEKPIEEGGSRNGGRF